jgi:hypothetical protein
MVGLNTAQFVNSYRDNLREPTPRFLSPIARNRPSGGANLRTELQRRGRFEPS